MQRAVSKVGFFLRSLPRNIVNVFAGRNILWHIAAIALTAIIVLSGFDWWYFVHTRMVPREVIFPAVILGALLPILVPIILLVIGCLRNSDRVKTLGFALGQAAVIGSIISSLYKAFTGRIQPALDTSSLVDISREFNFGFWKHGIFWGWPSSHTTIAFAMAVALIVLYPKNTPLKIATLIYAFYIGLAVSVSIHWFSEFAAGVIFGAVIGVIVGKAYTKLSAPPRLSSEVDGQ